jgi:hypothetical protein
MANVADSSIQLGPIAKSLPGLPFVTVGPAGSNYPYDGIDIGASINAAGLAFKNATGGTVFISGGVGTVYTVATQVVFYNTVNYIGDGVTLKAASILSNPFTTDTNDVYWSGVIAGLTLDAHAVAGSACFNVISAQQSTFYDLHIQNASGGAGIPVTASPFTYTNGTSIAQIIQVKANGAKISALAVNGASQDGVVLTQDYGIFIVNPGNSIVITYSLATPTLIRCSIGLLMTVSATIAPHNSTSGRNNSGNSFLSLTLTACQVGVVFQGDPVASKQCTNHVFSSLQQYGSTAAALVFAGNCDSITLTEAKLHIQGVGTQGVVFNCYNPSNDQACYFNRIYACSIDTDASSSQIGVVHNSNHSKPNYIEHFQPNSNIGIPVKFYATTANNCYIRDQVNYVTYIQFGRRGSEIWYVESPASGTPLVNATPFTQCLMVFGGSGYTGNWMIVPISRGAPQDMQTNSGVTLYTLAPGMSFLCQATTMPTVKSLLVGMP